MGAESCVAVNKGDTIKRNVIGSRTTLSSAWPSCSLVYWKVRDAKGVIWAPKELEELMPLLAQGHPKRARAGRAATGNAATQCTHLHVRDVLPDVAEVHDSECAGVSSLQ